MESYAGYKSLTTRGLLVMSMQPTSDFNLNISCYGSYCYQIASPKIGGGEDGVDTFLGIELHARYTEIC